MIDNHLIYDEDISYDAFDDDDVIDHDDLAHLLLELIEQEHHAIRTLDMERYTTLAQARTQMCQQIIDLARDVEIPEESHATYYEAHMRIEENAKLLQDAHQIVRGMIQRLTDTPKASTYHIPGQTRRAKTSTAQGIMVWKG